MMSIRVPHGVGLGGEHACLAGVRGRCRRGLSRGHAEEVGVREDGEAREVARPGRESDEDDDGGAD
eukprot:419710-Rhodomonas_salina.2